MNAGTKHRKGGVLVVFRWERSMQLCVSLGIVLRGEFSYWPGMGNACRDDDFPMYRAARNQSKHLMITKLNMHSRLTLVLFSSVAFATISARAGVTITPVYHASFSGNANFAALQVTVNNALAIYSSNFGNNLTLPITFKLDATISGAQSSYGTVGYSYSAYRDALAASATTAADATALANLPAGPTDPVIGSANINVPEALAFTLGLGAAVANYGTVSFNLATYQSNPGGFLGVIQHEINEVLGTASSLPNNTGAGVLPTTIAPADLFRYATVATRSFTLNLASDTANKAFFRLSPGGANLQEFNNLPNGGDYGDWAANGSFAAAPQDQAGDSNTFTSMSLSTAELSLLDAVGYGVIPVPEPGTVTILASMSLAGLSFLRRRRS